MSLFAVRSHRLQELFAYKNGFFLLLYNFIIKREDYLNFEYLVLERLESIN